MKKPLFEIHKSELADSSNKGVRKYWTENVSFSL